MLPLLTFRIIIFSFKFLILFPALYQTFPSPIKLLINIFPFIPTPSSAFLHCISTPITHFPLHFFASHFSPFTISTSFFTPSSAFYTQSPPSLPSPTPLFFLVFILVSACIARSLIIRVGDFSYLFMTLPWILSFFGTLARF